MEQEKNLLFLIDEIIKLREFWNANYYARCMKKAPHGGVMRICTPNGFLKYYPFQAWSFIAHTNDKIPYFLINLVDKATTIYQECDLLDIEELMQFCFSGDNWYLGYRLLQTKPEYYDLNNKHSGPLLWSVLTRRERISDYFDIEPRIAAYGLILILIQEKAVIIPDVETIAAHEVLHNPHNKYGLTETDHIEFLRQGFKFQDKYYLYNLFVDTTIGSPTAHMPITFEIITKCIKDVHLFMRCDEQLAVPIPCLFSTDTVDFQKYHGITLVFANIEAIIHKEIVVHIHPELLHKIVIIIKPDSDLNGQFYHVEIEELWNPDKITDEAIMATFIHAKYYPMKKGFSHIDYSINQYDRNTYSAKYAEATNITHIPIDKYGMFHYKVWCVEANHIEVDIWSKLVCATLDEPFREIFLEAFKSESVE